MLEKYYEISSSKPPDFLLLIFDVQYIIGFEHYVEFLDPLPLIHDKEDENNSKFLNCV